MTTARQQAGAAFDADGNLYVIGSAVGANFLNSVERYVPGATEWESLCPLPSSGTTEWAVGAALGCDGNIYAVRSTGASTINRTMRAFCYNADDDTWDVKATMPNGICLLYTSPSPRDRTRSRMPSSA